MSRLGVSDARAGRLTPGQLLTARGLVAGLDPGTFGPGWRALSDYYTEIAAALTGDLGLSVVVAPNAAGGHPGRHMPAASRIDLDGNLLPVAPDQLRPSEPDGFARLAALHGVFRHEVGHATYSLWTPRPARAKIAEAMALLEEIRMESRVAADYPAAVRWMRAAARTILLTDLDQLPANAWGVANLATLLPGRVAAGVLSEADLGEWTGRFQDALGQAWVPLTGIWAEAIACGDRDYDTLAALAARLVELFPPDDPDTSAAAGLSVGRGNGVGVGTGDGGEQAQGVGAGDGKSLPVGLVADLSELVEQIADTAAAELADAVDGTNLAQDVESRVNIELALTVSVPADFQEDWGAFAASSAGGERLVRWTFRPASGAERAAASRLTGMLRRASWRDRQRVRTAQALPPGRLRPRAALAAAADEAAGRMDSALPWRRTQHRWVDSPNLRLGLLVDVSGSMWQHNAALSSAAWVLGRAVTDLGGQALAVTFGQDATVVYDGVSRTAPEKVMDFLAVANREAIVDALTMADVGLGFVDAPPQVASPGVVVVLSDGVWTDSGEVGQAHALMAAMRAAGVRIVQVNFRELPYAHPSDEQLAVAEGDDLVAVVGQALLRVLRAPGAVTV